MLYLSNTRPDISFAIQQLSQFVNSPTKLHLQEVHRVLRYVKSSLAQILFFPVTAKIELAAFVDSDWATCPKTRRSVTGFCVFLGDSLINWKSKKQMMVSHSSSEAEYRAFSTVTSEVQWLLYVLCDLGCSHTKLVNIFCDNSAAIHIARNPIFHE